MSFVHIVSFALHRTVQEVKKIYKQLLFEVIIRVENMPLHHRGEAQTETFVYIWSCTGMYSFKMVNGPNRLCSLDGYNVELKVNTHQVDEPKSASVQR